MENPQIDAYTLISSFTATACVAMLSILWLKLTINWILKIKGKGKQAQKDIPSAQESKNPAKPHLSRT